MEDFFSSYWWLLFPLGFFIFGAWDRWLAYKRSQDRLELLRSYTNQGKDPPPELMKVLQREEDEDEEAAIYDRHGRHARRYYRRHWRYGPYWAWRGAIVTGAVAAGFWFASEYADIPGLADMGLLAATTTAGGFVLWALWPVLSPMLTTVSQGLVPVVACLTLAATAVAVLDGRLLPGGPPES